MMPPQSKQAASGPEDMEALIGSIEYSGHFDTKISGIVTREPQL